MINIFLSIQSKKSEVIAFLDELKTFLEKCDFNLDTDFVLIRKNKRADCSKRNEPTKNRSPFLGERFFFVFGKNINGKLIYIKLKIKGDQKRHVLCVSFHYAKDRMKFPYASLELKRRKDNGDGYFD